MKVFRSIRQIYDRTRYFGHSSTSGSSDDLYRKPEIGNQKCVKFEVKTKVGKKYEVRTLEILQKLNKSGKQEWILYVIKYSDYTSYDCFSLSDSFITQMFDSETSNLKCTLVFVEDVLNFKMASLSDKWRLIEFIRANIASNAYVCSGFLENSPLLTSNQKVNILFHHTSLVIINKSSQQIITHKSLFDMELIVFKEEKTSFVCKTSKESEFWSIRAVNMEKLADLIYEAIEIRGLSVALNHVRKESEYVQIPSFDSFYTDF
ncbi:SKN-1 Dependent Zygotic transcript [Caenorhabditis elegans]|uniref:SKN-1 Dependent Zygotic transcript n=1 Tax=Caenorhabditis elegans TaxID=6239 RepID=Q19411_CAEEL|nr:SKN-1 Dependent Zygotic transcript [Caenorhabditis elegans]CAA93409.2 SKN-1 Dependent Zygotic transcript [Caenorhabditis elegans]|eukprot:NP_502018.2 SKN-1 Dependent Zygotic transcript [Caenorhabditis elegans]